MIHVKKHFSHATRVQRLTAMTVGLLAALTMAVALAPMAKADYGYQRGCPPDAFCIYAENAFWNENHPSYIMRPFNPGFDDHQWWNTRNHDGIHKVFNNGWPGGGVHINVWLNSGFNGAGPVLKEVAAGKSYDLDLTDVNSVTLWFEQLTNNGL